MPAIKMWQLTDSLTHEEAAKIIGNHFEEVSDKLLNILELNDIKGGQRDLIDASIKQKIETIKLTPFNKAIDWDTTLYYSRYLIIPIVIIICFWISGNKNMISESTLRIIKYNTEFTKPAPFYFELNEDSLFAIAKDNKVVDIKIYGDERPADLYIYYDNKIRKPRKISNSKYQYTFKNVRESIRFYFSGANEYSKEYELRVQPRPEIENLTISIVPPKHTDIDTQVLKNVGSVSVPEGSVLKWVVQTKNTDTVAIKLNENRFLLSQKTDGDFHLQKRISKNSKYSISLASLDVSFIDSVFYDIKIIKDLYPLINIEYNAENGSGPIISGSIRDDYGFLDLTCFSVIEGEKQDTLIQENIIINDDVRSQSFLHTMAEIRALANPGESVKCYFVVRDNDKNNGYKSTRSETIQFNIPTHDLIKEDYAQTNESVKNDITVKLDLLENLKKELSEFEKSIIEKDSLDWRDRKKLEDILNKQSGIEKKIEDLKKTTKNNFDQMNSMSEPSEELLKKQQELEKLFDEIMPEEMKELYKELNDLRDKLDKNELQKKLQELQFSNEDLEKELDRNLEILKQVEFEQELEDIINQLKKLSQEQMERSGQDEEILKKMEDQLKQIEKFEKIQENIENLKSLNDRLDNKHNIDDTKLKEEEIKKELNNTKENLERRNEKKASKSQQKASEKLQELANFFENMKQENESEKNYEDMEVLRQILENLVYFSIEEENIFLKFGELSGNDPKYVELMHTQQSLRESASIIEDSLFALSKRVPKISSKVNREINAIDSKTQSAIDYLRERETLKAVQDQQFVMTSANNLAVLLANILEQMQQEMASDTPSTQQCEKPGKGSPKPGDLKKMQQGLKEHLEKMKGKLEKGEQNDMQKGGVSKELVEMLAKQELIRRSLEEIRDQMENKSGLNALEDAIKNMQKTEEDIANKKITMESLMRQKKIMTRLLEVENAIREQEEDEKRESRTAVTEYERIVQEAYEKHELKKIKQTEMIKTTPPSLKTYYKQKVDRYFNLMIQE